MMKNQEVKKSMETKDNESGRSMVEMLGVLAIMGVLAIGGVAGYRWAMDKYNANEILNEVRKRAITASQQRILGQEINLKEFYPNTEIDMIQKKWPTTPMDHYNNDSAFFTITVSDLDDGICEHLVDSKIRSAVAIAINGVELNDDVVCEDDDNSVTFVFANNLDGNSGVPDPEEICNTNNTCYSCDANDAFVIDAKQCHRCSKRFVGYDGKCYSCATNKNIDASEDECGRCHNREINDGGYCVLKEDSCDGVRGKVNGYCYDCSYSSSIVATSEECSKCDNTNTPRYMFNGYCYKTCPTNTVPDYETGRCECEVGYFKKSTQDSNGIRYERCISCANSGDIEYISQEECDKCADTENPRIYGQGINIYCTPCSSESAIYGVSEAYCTTICGDQREYHRGYCVLKKDCNGFLNFTGNKCYDCSEPSAIGYGTGLEVLAAAKEECGKCPNREVIRDSNASYCSLKKEFCDGFRSVQGTCYSCSYSGGVETSAEECAKCAASETPRAMNGQYCVLATKCPTGTTYNSGTGLCECEAGNFLGKTNGQCYSCSDNTLGYLSTPALCSVCDNTSTPRFSDTQGYCFSCSDNRASTASRTVTVAECNRCLGSDSPRYMKGQNCILGTECPTGTTPNAETGLCECAPGSFMDSNGTCRDCSVTASYSVGSEKACEACSNTKTPRKMYNNYCILDVECDGIRSSTGGCTSCSKTNASVYLGGDVTDKDTCDKCSNWRPYGENYCVSCDGFYAGSCFSCGYFSEANMTTVEECDRCPNRLFNTKDKKCYPCNTSAALGTNAEQCAKCSNREMYKGNCVIKESTCVGFRSNNGSCYQCSYYGPVATSSEECDKCSDREMQGAYCVKKGCTGFFSSDGYCNNCSNSSSVFTSEEECSKCAGTDNPRFYWNKWCYKTCPTDKHLVGNFKTGTCECDSNYLEKDPNYYGNSEYFYHGCISCAITGSGFVVKDCHKCDETGNRWFLGLDRKCYSCLYNDSVSTSTNECKRCGNRYKNGSYCYKCPTSLASSRLNTQDKCESCGGKWNGSSCS